MMAQVYGVALPVRNRSSICSSGLFLINRCHDSLSLLAVDVAVNVLAYRNLPPANRGELSSS